MYIYIYMCKHKASYLFIMFSLNERKEHFCLQIYKRFIAVCNPMVKGIVVLHPRCISYVPSSHHPPVFLRILIVFFLFSFYSV